MSTRPYARSPDTFWLVLGEDVDGLTWEPFETVYGPSDEVLGFYDGTLIGRRYEGASDGRTVVELTPALTRDREYPWPTLTAFQAALSTLLVAGTALELGCERDADQAPVEFLSDAGAASGALSDVLGFCAGQRDDCPSFRYAVGLSI